MTNPEMPPKPKQWETLTLGQIIEKIKSNPEAQKKAFGDVLTEEQFKQKFPHDSATGEDVRNMMLALGLELPTKEDLEHMLEDKSSEVDKPTEWDSEPRVFTRKE